MPISLSTYKLKDEDLSPAVNALREITEQMIVQVVCNIPEEWSINIDEKLALVEYLTQRQHDLLANF